MTTENAKNNKTVIFDLVTTAGPAGIDHREIVISVLTVIYTYFVELTLNAHVDTALLLLTNSVVLGLY